MSTASTSPFRLNLEQQKKRARELQRALLAGDPAALARLQAQHPKAAWLSAAERGRLSEAQLVIARELDLPSWPRLQEHIAALEAAGRGTGILDEDCPTLHIRCGWDIQASLRAGHFAGDFLEYSNPFCQGPVILDGAFLSRRAAFLAQAYDLDPQEATDKLRREEAALSRAAESYERIVLWSEHDPYDQLVLIRLLAHFAEQRPRRLELIGVNAFPGAVRFIGLGQLPPEALRLLWRQRRIVTDAQLALGRAAWQALAAPDPRPLAELAQGGASALPDLGPALLRHLAELPERRSGLSLTQLMTLQILREDSCTVGEAFAILMRRREPLPWLGDLMYWSIVREMQRAASPPFLLDATGPWPQRCMRLTETGQRLLDGGLDWLSLAPPARWVGGVPIAGPDCWRWDQEAQQPTRPTLSPPRKREAPSGPG